ncbi:MAG: GMC family oxidoreductase [Deltaproteobacteria bacterium]|nr:GMC family oxidoreductase [Deltaproteobacteria bacterium]
MPLIEGRSLEHDLEEWTDAVVVGSGAGGAVVAKELSEAGLDVVVLEEGPHVPGEIYGRWRPTETLRHLGREAGTTAVLGIGDTPIITVMAGRAVGGSSILTGGVCFRIPSIIHHRWMRERGLDMLSEEAMAPAFASAERESHVEVVPEHMRSGSTTKFVEGARKLGIPVKSMSRNTDGCVGWSRCNFGCPVHAKISVDRSYLPKALARGVRVYSDCIAGKITHRYGRASGVSGRFLAARDARGNQRRTHRITVHADTVVVAAGTLHTPLLLMKSGLRSPSIGRHMTLHPGFRVVARFEERIDGWKGALQSVFVDHFEREGVTLTGLFLPPNVLAAGLPGVGPELAERVGNLGHLAVFGGIVHDEEGGRVHRFFGREPLLTYRLAPADKEHMIRGVQVLARIYLEAGAREVFPPFFGMQPIRSVDEIGSRVHTGLSARKMECVTFHPLGSCRIGRNAGEGVVNPWGESFELPGLFVADGSVFPTSIGVNSQLPIMAMATRIAWQLAERLGRKVRPVNA